MLSGGRDSVCMLDLAVRARGAGAVDRPARQLRPARRLRRGRAPLRRALRVARGGAGGRAAAAARGPGQPAGLGARPPLRGRGAAGAAADGDDRHRPHRRRPGRDDPLPARLLAEPPRPARDAPARRHAWRGRCSASPGRRPPPTASERGLAWRDDRTNAEPTYARNRDPRTASCRSWPRSTRRRRRNVLRTAALLRDEAEVLDALVAAELDGSGGSRRGTIALRAPARSCTRRCADSSSSSSPTAPPADRSRAPPATPRRSPALRRTGAAMLDLGGGVRAVARARRPPRRTPEPRI